MFKKLSKSIGKALLWIIVLLLVVLGVGYYTMGSWLPSVVHKVVPQVTQTTATLGSADISLFSGRVSFKGLIIGNPAGFESTDAFKLDEITVLFQPKSVLTDKIIVDKVLIKGTQVTAELNKAGKINLMQLNQNVQNYLNAGVQQPKAVEQNKTAANDKKAGKAVVIKDLQINDTAIRLGVLGQMQTINMPNIHETNIGEKQRSSIPDTIMLLVNELTLKPVQEITKAGQRALNNTINMLAEKQGNSDTVKFLKNSLKNLF